MPIPTLSTPPTTPQRLTDTPDEFVTNMDAWLTYEAGLSSELNTWATAVASTVSGVDFNGTSATSLAIGTGSKSFTASTGKLWNVGQFVIAASAANVANYMVGQVTAYNSGTGALVVNMVSTGGSGTLADWIISIAPSPGDFITASGSATLTNKTLAFGSNTVSGTLAQFNTACSDADFASLAGAEALTNKTINLASNTVTTTLALLNTAVSDADVASLAGAETLTNKRFQRLGYQITDGAGFAIDPGNGHTQYITLGAARTPTAANWANGDHVRLYITAAGYTIDWSTVAVTWADDTSAPTLDGGMTVIDLERVNGTIYGRKYSAPAAAGTGISYVGGGSQAGSLGSGFTSSISLTSLTGGSGTAPIADDFVVITVAAGSTSDLNIAMTSGGWTEHQDLYANSTADANLAVYYKKMGSSPDTSFQLNIPSSSNQAYAVAWQVFRGVDTTTPLDTTSTTANSTTSHLVNPASITPVSSPNCLVICGAGNTYVASSSGAYTASYLNNFVTTGAGGSQGSTIVGMGYLKNLIAAYDGAAWTSSLSDTTAAYQVCTMLLRAA